MLAREIMTARRSDILRGAAGITGSREVRFFELVEKYLDSTQEEKRSHQQDCNTARILRAYIGNKRLIDIENNELLIRGFIRARQAGEIESDDKKWRPVKRTTVNRNLALLRRMFNKGSEWGVCSKNPVKRGMIDQRAEEEAKRSVYMSPEEVRAYLQACTPWYYPVALTALLTGMRAGEIQGLTWDRVDLRNGIFYLERTKGGKRREIRVPDELTNVLRKLESKKHGQYVFCNRHGEHYRDFREAHSWTLKRSGIQERRQKNFEMIADPEERRAAEKKNRIIFHTLRHTFGTLLAKDCRDLNLVKKAMGHASITTTERYAHVIEDVHREAIRGFTRNLLHTNCTPVDFEKVKKKAESRKTAVNEGSFFDTPEWRNW